jgi:hypothetical protein
MTLNVADLVLSRLIAHEVPQKESGTHPQLSDEDRAPDARIRNFFRERLSGSLNESGIDVVFDSSGNPTIKTSVATLYATPKDLVAVSKEMAKHLFSVQNRQNTAGLLVVATGTIQNHATVAILKLEHEEGIRVIEGSEKGVRTFNLEYLNSLVLTKRTKVFKVGLFVERKPAYARVSEEQFGRGADRGVAEFFLREFDSEIQASRDAAVKTRGFEEGSMLVTLDRYYFELTGRAYDSELSFYIVHNLKDLYDEAGRRGFDATIHDFVESQRERLAQRYADYGDDDRANPLLFQPEALMIIERLQANSFAVKEAWERILPLELLENFAGLWGVTI